MGLVSVVLGVVSCVVLLAYTLTYNRLRWRVDVRQQVDTRLKRIEPPQLEDIRMAIYLEGPVAPPPPIKPRPKDKSMGAPWAGQNPPRPKRDDRDHSEPDLDFGGAEDDELPAKPELPPAPEEVEFRSRVQDVERHLQRALEFVAQKTGHDVDDLSIDYEEWPFERGVPVVYTEYRQGEPIDTMHWVLFEELFPRSPPKKKQPETSLLHDTRSATEKALPRRAFPLTPPTTAEVREYKSWFVWRDECFNPPVAVPGRIIHFAPIPRQLSHYFRNVQEWSVAREQVMDKAQQGIFFISTQAT